MNILFVTALVVTLDQIVKLSIKNSYYFGESVEIFGNILQLTFIQNSGMAFGIRFGSESFFTISASIATLIIFIYLYRSRYKAFHLRLALALILGGAISNNIDRIAYGAVIDFIDIGIGSTRWPVFNIADACVNLGMIILIGSILGGKGESEFEIRTGRLTTLYGGVTVDPIKSDTTRYLAASALLKGSSFRRQIIDHVNKKHTAFAPELGIDLPFLVRICKNLEDKEKLYYNSFFVISIIFLLLVIIAVIKESYNAIIAIIFITIAIAWTVRFYKGYLEYRWLTNFFIRDKFDPQVVLKIFETASNSQTTEIISRNDQNLITYSGFSPFVGVGINLGGWSFAVDLSKSKTELGQEIEVKSFTLEDLYSEITLSLQQLKFDGLKIRDVLFVNGTDIRSEKWILNDIYAQPTSHVDAETISRFIDSNDSRIRHYKWIEIHDWGYELIVSYFLRCSRRGKNLFVEASVFLLTPIADGYRVIDALVPFDWPHMIELSFRYLLLAPVNVFSSWFIMFDRFLSWFDKRFNFRERSIRKQIKNTPLYDYGAAYSLRGKMSSQEYFHYFQRLDKEMYTKVLERELLDTIVKFLDEHNIDTSDLRERQTTIMNSGIIVQGGDIRAASLAVGTGAQAETKKTKLFERKSKPIERETS